MEIQFIHDTLKDYFLVKGLLAELKLGATYDILKTRLLVDRR